MSENSNRVLICEDEAILRVWLEHELSRHGFEVVGMASDGEAAVELSRSTTPDFILMDIKMPRKDGLTASAEIMQERPTAIIVLTAYGESDMVTQALDAGVSGYLVKPIEATQLVPAISLARARFADLMQARDQVKTLEEALELRKLLDRAKGALIRQYGLDEPGAHQLLQRMSSQQRVPLKDVVQRVINATIEQKNKTEKT